MDMSENKCESTVTPVSEDDLVILNKSCDVHVKSSSCSDISDENVSKVCANETVGVEISKINCNISGQLENHSNIAVLNNSEVCHSRRTNMGRGDKVCVSTEPNDNSSTTESSNKLDKVKTIDPEQKMEVYNDSEVTQTLTSSSIDNKVDISENDSNTSIEIDKSSCTLNANDKSIDTDVIESKSIGESHIDEIQTNNNEESNVIQNMHTDTKQVDVEISNKSNACSTISKELIKTPNETSVGAFTKCQDSETEDSDSDSDESESESDSSAEESEKISEEPESSDEEEPVKAKLSANGETNQNQREKKKKGGAKYKHELDLEDLPPIEDLHITVLEDECEPLGTVYSIVNQLVVIQALPNTPALNLDSLIFKKDGHCLGQIFDVFGPVKTPFYTLRFNTHEDIKEKGIEKGQTVYCAPQTPHTKYVFTYQLMKQKGSDASWRHNYEVPEAYQDYSDDEQERRAHRKGQQKARGRPSGLANDSTPQKHVRVKKELNHNYDRFTGNEWYKSRANEMNQFSNRSHQSPNFNRLQSVQQPPNQNYQFSPHQNSFYRNNSYEQIPSSPSNMNSFASMPPPILRPPTPIGWHRPQLNSSTGFSGPPPMPFSSPPPQYNQSYQMTPPYEKLTPPNFSNPISPKGPPPNWQTNPNHVPFGINNSRNTNYPSPILPPLSKPNMMNIRPVPPAMPPNLFSQPPPGPPSNNY